MPAQSFVSLATMERIYPPMTPAVNRKRPGSPLAAPGEQRHPLGEGNAISNDLSRARCVILPSALNFQCGNMLTAMYRQPWRLRQPHGRIC